MSFERVASAGTTSLACSMAWITQGYFTRYSPVSSLAAFKLALSNYTSE